MASDPTARPVTLRADTTVRYRVPPRRRTLGLVAAALLGGGVVPSAAASDEPSPTPQDARLGAAWVAGLRSEDLAPSRAAVCVVDSGIAVTPDTPADAPDGPILVRTSITPETMPGTPPTGGDAAAHGTVMAAAAIAPRNGWGTAGLHPLGRVISVRALADGRETFDADAVRAGVSRCRTLQRQHRVVAVALSLGHVTRPTEEQVAPLSDEILSTRQQGIAVVAAAGNDPAAATQLPAALDGVLAVGAGGADGFCAFATRDARVDLLGPGCDAHTLGTPLDGRAAVDGSGGSSLAAAWTATAVAVLCDLAPQLTGTAAEALLREAARGARPGAVDLEAAARAAGAGAAVDRARARLAVAPAQAAPAPRPAAVQQVRARWRRGVLRITVRRRPAAAAVRVRVLRRGATLVRRIPPARVAVAVRLRRRPRAVTAQALLPGTAPATPVRAEVRG